MKYTWSEIYDSIWYGEEFALFYQGKRYFLQAWEKDGIQTVSVQRDMERRSREK